MLHTDLATMENSVITRPSGAFGRVGGAVALFLVVLALVACGTAAEPQPTTPPPATEAAAAATTGEQATSSPATSGKLAPNFQLPDTSGETVSLDSYMGNRNVVVVFYRGFW